MELLGVLPIIAILIGIIGALKVLITGGYGKVVSLIGLLLSFRLAGGVFVSIVNAVGIQMTNLIDQVNLVIAQAINTIP